MGAGEKTPNLFEAMSHCNGAVHTAAPLRMNSTCTLIATK